MIASKRREVLLAVEQERVRQDELLDEGEIHTDCADPLVLDRAKLPVLLEEVGEVSRAMNDYLSPKELREELIQTAAVAVAWAESL